MGVWNNFYSDFISKCVDNYKFKHSEMADECYLQNNASNSDDSESEHNLSIPELKGYLSKWTNYIHGWQPRFIVLKDGTLSYYKSEQDSDFGCRGAISLQKATIKVRGRWDRRRNGGGQKSHTNQVWCGEL